MQISPALAWEAGTYTGTSADGQNVSFIVGTDTNTGNLQITSFNLGITAPCKPGTYVFMTGWGLGGDGADLTTKTTTYTLPYPYLYLTARITYSASGASGTITSYTPTFAAVTSGHPKKSLFCTSPAQSFTTTYAATTTSSVAAGSTAKIAPVGMLYGTLIKKD